MARKPTGRPTGRPSSKVKIVATAPETSMPRLFIQ